MKELVRYLLRVVALVWVRLFYVDIWRFKESCRRKPSMFKELLFSSYCSIYGASIGIRSVIGSPYPVIPHNLYGIFISEGAKIGRNAVIFQQVTIGSNTLPDSKMKGCPVIGDDVYIGAGAKIIGNVRVGDRARIGAGAVVVKDVPADSVVVLGAMRVITSPVKLANKMVGIAESKPELFTPPPPR